MPSSSGMGVPFPFFPRGVDDVDGESASSRSAVAALFFFFGFLFLFWR